MRAKARTIAYWALTGIVAFEMIAGCLWDVLRIEFTRVNIAHLGYPAYFPLITGVWKLPAGVVVLLPRFQRVKEWAYAGMIFTYSGAVASHLFVGDGASKWVLPLVFGLLTAGSWALRPPDRRLASPRPQPEVRQTGWWAPIAVAAGLFVLAVLTIPKGPPPP